MHMFISIYTVDLIKFSDFGIDWFPFSLKTYDEFPGTLAFTATLSSIEKTKMREFLISILLSHPEQ